MSELETGPYIACKAIKNTKFDYDSPMSTSHFIYPKK